jgi:hypothetical protein
MRLDTSSSFVTGAVDEGILGYNVTAIGGQGSVYITELYQRLREQSIPHK